MAFAIVEEYYDKETAENSEKEFNNIFKKGGIPDNIETISIDRDEIDIKDEEKKYWKENNRIGSS